MHQKGCKLIYCLIFAEQKPINKCIMRNDKWVKTFIQADGVVNVTAIPLADKPGFFQTEANVMIGGKMTSKLLYAGDNADRASDALEKFGRAEMDNFLDAAHGRGKDTVVPSDSEDDSTADEDIPQTNGPGDGPSGPEGITGADGVEGSDGKPAEETIHKGEARNIPPHSMSLRRDGQPVYVGGGNTHAKADTDGGEGKDEDSKED